MSSVLKIAAPIVGGMVAGPTGAAIGSAAAGMIGGGGKSVPSFNQQDFLNSQIQAGTFGVDSPLGNINIARGPSGEIVRQFEQSEADKTRNRLIGQGLGGLDFDPTRAEDAFFQRQTRLLNPLFDRAQERQEENLLNRGLQLGSEQFGQAQEDLRNQQSGILSDIANQAVFSGQGLLGSQIGNINQLGAGRDINTLSNIGSNIGATGLQSGFQQSLADQQARALEKAQSGAALGQLGGAIGGILAAPRDNFAGQQTGVIGPFQKPSIFASGGLYGNI